MPPDQYLTALLRSFAMYCSCEKLSKLYVNGLFSGKLIKLEHFLSTVQILEFAYVRVDIFPLPNAFSYVKCYIRISILTTDEKWM